MGLKLGTVRLEEYNPVWEKEFEKEKEILKSILRDYAVSIEHIGSTSIKGISAKPIIDIAIGVDILKSISFIKDKFSNYSDYSVKEDSVEGEILVVKRFDKDYTTHLIHIMEIEKERYKDSILFRDYLIKNSDIAKRYEKLKIALAKKYADDRKKYTSSKTEFITAVLNEARKKIG